MSLVPSFVHLYADPAQGPKSHRTGLTGPPTHPYTPAVLLWAGIREGQPRPSSLVQETSALSPLVHLPPVLLLPLPLLVPWRLRSMERAAEPMYTISLVVSGSPLGLCLAICLSAVGLPSVGKEGDALICDLGSTLPHRRPLCPWDD